MEYLAISETFAEEPFLKKLSVSHTDLGKLINPDEWEITASSMLPITRRLSCARVLGAFRPLMNQIAPEPEEGWLSFVYQTAVNHLYLRPDLTHTPLQQDAALCFLHVLRALFDEERRVLPFDFWLDFDFCTEEELQHSSIAREYRQFMRAFREEYVYELLRLGREVTPFKTLDHIAGVHHVAMKTARAFKRGGGKIDLALMSGAAAGHDIGKYGCLPGERVPYLHYYYSDQWFTQRNLNTIGHIAANHSVWDLEIENLSSESLEIGRAHV